MPRGEQAVSRRTTAPAPRVRRGAACAVLPFLAALVPTHRWGSRSGGFRESRWDFFDAALCAARSRGREESSSRRFFGSNSGMLGSRRPVGWVVPVQQLVAATFNLNAGDTVSQYNVFVGLTAQGPHRLSRLHMKYAPQEA